MKAWKIRTKQLHLVDVPSPQVSQHQVCIRVEAIGINRADLLQIKGLYPAPPGVVPDIPGLEYVGVIESAGDGCSRRRPGDRVMGLVAGGAFAEYLVCHEDETLDVPDGITVAQAATLPESFTTAYRALVTEAQLKSEEWCLVRPASAAVGMAAAQLATAMGAQVIGSSRHLSRLEPLLDQGILNESIEDPFTRDTVHAVTEGHGLDVVIDMVGHPWDELVPAMSRNGRLVLLGLLGGIKANLPLGDVLMGQLHIHAMTLRSQPLAERLRLASHFQRYLIPMFERGQLLPLPHCSYPFLQAADALDRLQHSATPGKHVLLLGH